MSADPGHELETTDPIPLEERQVSRVEPRPSAPKDAQLHVQQAQVASPRPQQQPQNQGKGQQQPKQKGQPQPPQQKQHGAPEVVELVKIRQALDTISKTASEAEASSDAAVEAVQELAVWLKKELEAVAVRQKKLYDGVEAQTAAVKQALGEQRRLMNALSLSPEGRKKLQQAAHVPWWASWKLHVLVALGFAVGGVLALLFAGG